MERRDCVNVDVAVVAIGDVSAAAFGDFAVVGDVVGANITDALSLSQSGAGIVNIVDAINDDGWGDNPCSLLLIIMLASSSHLESSNLNDDIDDKLAVLILLLL